jgi:hypothetical protein
MTVEEKGVKDRFNISLGKDTYLLLLKARRLLEEREGKGVSLAKTIKVALQLLLEFEKGEEK